jgi:hypothetical protein
VRYASDSDKPTCPEVKVKRKGVKGVKVRVGLSQAVRTVRVPARSARLETH